MRGIVPSTTLAPRPRGHAGLLSISLKRASHAVLCLALAAAVAPAAAQTLPSTPITTAGGRLTLGADASASYARNDETYFNYSDYNYDLLRLVRFDGTADFRLNDRVSLLGDLRVEGALGDGSVSARPFALFVRVRPWPRRAFDVQAGLIPPVFGAFSRRTYGPDNPLIGFPLGYQYLTSLRADALPATADDLLRMRGRGWRASYPVGNAAPDHGVPLVDALNYQTGVEAHVGNRPVEASIALGSGSPAAPRPSAGSGGAQVSGRVAYWPVPGLVLGLSAARGSFLAPAAIDAIDAVGDTTSNDQRALGFDVEYSRGYWLVRSEAIFSSWHLPSLRAPLVGGPLRAFAIDVESRYRISPGLYVAARVDRLDFSDITGTAGTSPWDAPVRRAEVGGGYSLHRNIVVKVAYQYNWRDTTFNRTSGLASAQLLFWF